jgi:hypothetical protein
MTREIVILVLRWIARIWGGFISAFIILIAYFYLRNPNNVGLNPVLEESVYFILFLLPIGFLIAFIWELRGGVLSILGIIGFHLGMGLTGDFRFDPLIDSMAIPGVIFIVISQLDIDNFRFVKTDRVERYYDV